MAPLMGSTGYENIVAVYESAATAETVVRDLRAAGIDERDIGRHARETLGGTGSATDAPAEGGFWSRLFGIEPKAHDRRVYDHTVAGGGAVVAVRVRDYSRTAQQVMAILESYHPIDIDERAARFGLMDQATAPASSHAPHEHLYDERRIDSSAAARDEGSRDTSRIRVYTVVSPEGEPARMRDDSL